VSYVIEHGIPIPPTNRGHKRRGALGYYTSRLSVVLTEMGVGGSFLVTTEKERAAVSGRLYRLLPRKYVVRKIAGEGWRVWRVA
jgi:hypothetical protein